MRLHEREIHGGTVRAGKSSTPVTLSERDNGIFIMKGGSSFGAFEISAASARVMARNLQRLARRIEAREAASAIETHRATTAGRGPKDESATAESGDAQ